MKTDFVNLMRSHLTKIASIVAKNMSLSNFDSNLSRPVGPVGNNLKIFDLREKIARRSRRVWIARADPLFDKDVFHRHTRFPHHRLLVLQQQQAPESDIQDTKYKIQCIRYTAQDARIFMLPIKEEIHDMHPQ
jgi:hypothetical protein